MSTAVDLDWDAWRAGYDEMTFADQQAFYREVAELYPLQESANVCMAHDAFDLIEQEHLTVIELGGWNGRLASQMLARGDIAIWFNFDLVDVPQAISSAEPRYNQVVLDDWFWAERRKADVFVAAHTIEHLSAAHLRQLIACLDVSWVYLEAPLEAGPRDWTGYAGSHILDIGWEGVGGIMLANGYKPVAENLWERQPSGVS